MSEKKSESFVDELRANRRARSAQHPQTLIAKVAAATVVETLNPDKTKTFTWDKTVNPNPKSDPAQPAADIARGPTAKVKKSTTPTKDIPKRLDGHIDLAEVRETLVSQMKSQRRR